MVKKKNKFVFPNAFLTQINEFSNGGFILINFDADKNPSVFFKFDDTLSALALLSHGEDWFAVTKSVNLDNMKSSLMRDFDNEDDSGEDDISEDSSK